MLFLCLYFLTCIDVNFPLHQYTYCIFNVKSQNLLYDLQFRKCSEYLLYSSKHSICFENLLASETVWSMMGLISWILDG